MGSVRRDIAPALELRGPCPGRGWEAIHYTGMTVVHGVLVMLPSWEIAGEWTGYGSWPERFVVVCLTSINTPVSFAVRVFCGVVAGDQPSAEATGPNSHSERIIPNVGEGL